MKVKVHRKMQGMSEKQRRKETSAMARWRGKNTIRDMLTERSRRQRGKQIGNGVEHVTAW